MKAGSCPTAHRGPRAFAERRQQWASVGRTGRARERKRSGLWRRDCRRLSGPHRGCVELLRETCPLPWCRSTPVGDAGSADTRPRASAPGDGDSHSRGPERWRPVRPLMARVARRATHVQRHTSSWTCSHLTEVGLRPPPATLTGGAAGGLTAPAALMDMTGLSFPGRSQQLRLGIHFLPSCNNPATWDGHLSAATGQSIPMGTWAPWPSQAILWGCQPHLPSRPSFPGAPCHLPKVGRRRRATVCTRQLTRRPGAWPGGRPQGAGPGRPSPSGPH